MRKWFFLTTVFLLFQCVLFGQASVQHRPGNPNLPGPHPGQGKWVSIATTEVRLNIERDVVNITGAQRFRAIKFQISRNPVEIYDLRVLFQNGQQQKFVVKNNFQPGTSSRVLNFTNGARRLRQIIFDYRSGGHLFNQRAYVQIFGLI